MTLEEKTIQLTMSPTLNRLAEMAAGMPVDVNNPEDLQSVLSACLVDLVEALDNGRISFTYDKDSAMLHGLLCVVMAQTLGKIEAQQVTVH